ncbi:L-glutaminase [Roseiarcus fermentans]|uniref:Glutaminase n=1 Tax=Roseiarcus fermentans TaxID=1473586 RepID=A0A366EVC1_9HYPH|nr:glutaminase A [Roseiarcus fermentans]RBP06274.1 L-glutaminase [Roseiarcus fermentans]
MSAGDARATPGFVSTGRLPAPETVAALVDEAFARFRGDTDGAVSSVYPTLARAPADGFGLCVAGTNGAVHTAGDWDTPFTIMSVSKPFVFALVCDRLGADAAREAIGVNATGLPFNALAAIERDAHGRTNPMVNPGAVATTSLVPGARLDERWAFLRDGLSRFAGHALALDEEVLACALESNARNRAIAQLLHSYGRIAGDPAEALELYTRQCALTVTAKDLAVMGATLADGGVNPLTRTRVVEPESGKRALAVMATAGLYETSGDWLYDVGLPGKSGIAGGIVAVSPGKGALGAFAPRLDAAGNSVKGQLAARFLSEGLGLSLFASSAEA